MKQYQIFEKNADNSLTLIHVFSSSEEAINWFNAYGKSGYVCRVVG